MSVIHSAPGLRSSSGAQDRLAVQLRLSHLLSTADLEPSTIPPAATLVVRHLPDPLPRRLCFDLHAVRPAVDWGDATRSALNDAGRNASRPALGFVPPTANAVLFADVAEFLACFVRDLISGQAQFHWWWRGLPGGIRATPAEEIVTALRREPRHIPAVLALLDDRKELQHVASFVTPAQAQVLLKEMLLVHGLPALLKAASVPRDPLLALPDEITPLTEARTPQRESRRASPMRPWEPTVRASATPASLGLERSALLGIGLLLHRAPHRARASRFERALRIWARDFSVHASHSTAFQAPTADGGVVSRSSLRNPREVTRVFPLPGKQDQPLNVQSAGTHPGSVDESDRKRRDELAFSSGVATELGGALFLIPFLRALGFPGILESEFRLEQPLSGWALLELMACGLLGASYRNVEHDPLWRALRLLDGRAESDPPASSFTGCATYRLPEAWRRTIPTQAETRVGLRFTGRRLLIRHSLGFTLLDWKTSHEITSRELANELTNLNCDGVLLDCNGRRSARRRGTQLCGPVPDRCCANSELLRFLHFFLPFLQWRLSSVLAQSGIPPKAAAAHVLRRHGRLYVTSTHVDLAMNLKHVSLPVRLAGLDANPGWVPELGRVVTFHYR